MDLSPSRRKRVGEHTEADGKLDLDCLPGDVARNTGYRIALSFAGSTNMPPYVERGS